jgi:hypothetical protein
MSLLARQIAFRDEITAGDDAGQASSPGMEIYRQAYRGRLLAALEAGFERTRRWVGEDSFTAAACHYILSTPPTGWTLDDYGAGFPQLLADLFRDDPDVGELAWMEWHLQQAFAADDAPELDPANLAAAGYTPGEWAGMRFTMAAGFAARRVSTDCTALWLALADDAAAEAEMEPTADCALLVWRRHLSPRYRLASRDEYEALAELAEGAGLAALTQCHDASVLGEWLAQWLGEGIFSRARP